MAKCYLCGKIIGDNEEVIPYKKTNVHKQCFDHIMKGYSQIEHSITKQKEAEKKQAKKEATNKIKPVEVEQEGLSEEEYRYKRHYYAYLRENLGLTDLPSKYYVMTERSISKYAYTYSGMYHTLVYIHDIQEKLFDPDKGNIISLIPWYYEEAMSYYSDLKKFEQDNKDKNINNMYQTRTIKVSKDKKRKGDTWEF